MRTNGKPAGTLIPPAFGLSGVNLSTFTGFGTVTYSAQEKSDLVEFLKSR